MTLTVTVIDYVQIVYINIQIKKIYLNLFTSALDSRQLYHDNNSQPNLKIFQVLFELSDKNLQSLCGILRRFFKSNYCFSQNLLPRTPFFEILG